MDVILTPPVKFRVWMQEAITDSGMEFLEEHGVDPRIEGKAGEPGRKQEGGQPMEPNPRSRN